MFVTTNLGLTSANECKRSTLENKKTTPRKRKLASAPSHSDAAIIANDLLSSHWQQILNSTPTSAYDHLSPNLNKVKRPKKDTEWPSLTSIAQLQAPGSWLWNPEDRSHATEIRSIGDEFQSVKFHPFWSNFGTAGIRGTKPLNGGIHYWQILLPGRVFGTSMMIGIGTQKAQVHADGFVHLLGGLDDESWGLCYNGQAWHNGRYFRYTSQFPQDEPTVIGVLFDGINDTLTFYKNGKCLGIAFSGVLSTIHTKDPDHPRYIFPMLGSTSAQTEMVLCCQLRNYTSLQDRCRLVIAKAVDYSERKIHDLPLPDQLKQFITHETSLYPQIV